jgi:ubiquitin C-terminal hydrolase
MAYVSLVEHTLAGTAGPDMAPALLQVFMQRRKALGLHTIGYGQECADEGYILFIETLNCPEAFNLVRNVYERLVICPGCKTASSTCRDDSYRIEMFGVLDVKTPATFNKWIHIHASPVDDYKCELCNVRSPNVPRVETVRVLREVIVIVLDKFYDKANLFFPDTLKFPSSGSTLTYKLRGVVAHSGSRSGGHYWAHVVRGDNVYCCNDGSVSSGSLAPTAETFLIGYALVA